MIGIIILVLSILVVVGCAAAWYRIVAPSEAHLVVTPSKQMVCSPDKNVSTTENKTTYFAIPKFLPFVGRIIRKMDITIKELILTQETYEKNQARYKVTSSMKYRIRNVITAAETYTNEEELKTMLQEVVQSAVRAVTVRYDVIDARSKKTEMSVAIREEITDDLNSWGLSLESFQLVDFQDTDDSKIISDISKRREIEIAATTREQNAEKNKQALVKEAAAEEEYKSRQIKKDEVVAMNEQDKKQKIAVQEKIARVAEYEIKKVEQVKQAEIDKEKAIVDANKLKEVEEINKETKRVEGEGDRLMQEEQAKGLAAPIREKGLAEAEAKEKLQAALNKFGDAAIRALVAEKVVAKEEAVGIALAQAYENADMKVFVGSDNGGFDFGKMISSIGVASGTTADAVANKIARPNDLGLTALGLKSVAEKNSKTTNNTNKTKSTVKQ